jgi:hypothetical protein
MMAATPTWTDPAHGGVSPYAIPVLLHHDDMRDAIGRVISAQYFKTWPDEQWENDWKRPSTAFNKGSGYTRLGLTITDMDAVQKFLDKRYLTFSTNFDSSTVICSVCGTNVMGEKKMCHQPGETYDDPSGTEDRLECYWIVPPSRYKEVSVVNHPAQPFAVAEGLKLVADSIEDSTLTSEDLSKRPIMGNMKVPNSDISLMLKDEATGNVTSLVLKEGQKDAIPSGSGTIRPSTKVVIPDISMIQSPKESTDTGVAKSNETGVMNDDDFALAHVAKLLHESGMLLSDAEMADFKGEDMMTPPNETVPSFDQCMDLVFTLGEAISDGKLTATQRNQLKSDHFCGPNRSFPVPDCAHVTAARKLIGRYKGSVSEKKRILASVNRKAAKMGYENSSDTGQQPKENQKMSDTNTTPAAGTAPSTAQPGETEASEKALQTMVEQLAEVRALNKQLQSDRDAKDAEVQKLTTEVTGLKDELHKERCLRLATMRSVTVKTIDSKNLDSQKAIEEYADGLKSRPHVSIQDALKDESQVLSQKLPHLKGLPNFIAELPKPEPATITRQVKDSEAKDSAKTKEDKLDI